MPQNDLENRVEFLEKTVASLAGLPQQVQDLSTQILQFREELSADISGVTAAVGDLRGEIHGIRDELRREMHGMRDELREDMHGMRDELRGEMIGLHEELRADMASMHRDLAGAILASQAQTLTLHEELVERIALLGEGRNSTGAAPPPDDAR